MGIYGRYILRVHLHVYPVEQVLPQNNPLAALRGRSESSSASPSLCSDARPVLLTSLLLISLSVAESDGTTILWHLEKLTTTFPVDSRLWSRAWQYPSDSRCSSMARMEFCDA